MSAHMNSHVIGSAILEKNNQFAINASFELPAKSSITNVANKRFKTYVSVEADTIRID